MRPFRDQISCFGSRSAWPPWPSHAWWWPCTSGHPDLPCTAPPHVCPLPARAQGLLLPQRLLPDLSKHGPCFQCHQHRLAIGATQDLHLARLDDVHFSANLPLKERRLSSSTTSEHPQSQGPCPARGTKAESSPVPPLGVESETVTFLWGPGLLTWGLGRVSSPCPACLTGSGGQLVM